MRWPFGPPHLTLKPSKKTEKTNQNKKKNKKQKNTKIPKMSFPVISQVFLCFWWVSKISLFWQLGPKSAHPKNTIKIQQSIFEEQMCVTKRPFLDKKKPQFRNSSYQFVFASFFLATTKNPKIAETPIFIVFWQTKTKKTKIPKNNLQQRNWKKQFLHPFFEKKKAIFRKLADNWAPKNIKW